MYFDKPILELLDQNWTLTGDSLQIPLSETTSHASFPLERSPCRCQSWWNHWTPVWPRAQLVHNVSTHKTPRHCYHGRHPTILKAWVVFACGFHVAGFIGILDHRKDGIPRLAEFWCIHSVVFGIKYKEKLYIYIHINLLAFTSLCFRRI